jgi:hypothetical protein
MERKWNGPGGIDAFIKGQLSTINFPKIDIAVVDKPTYSNISLLQYAKAVIFTTTLSKISHETLLFLDYHIPFVQSIENTICEYIGSEITLCCKNNMGVIDFGTTLSKPEFSKTSKWNGGFTSSIRGMDYLASVGAKYVATRGEFIYLQVMDIHPEYLALNNQKSSLYTGHLYTALSHGAKHINHVIHRFVDFSSENTRHLTPKLTEIEQSAVLGNRGLYRLLGSCRHIFELELSILNKLYSKYSNISVLLPYVRNADEAQKGCNLVRSNFSGTVGCMIEVPQNLWNAELLNKLFDFFVIGTSDQTQLLQGADRNLFEIHESTYLFLADLLSRYFMPKIASSKNVYIPSIIIYNILKTKYPNVILLGNKE